MKKTTESQLFESVRRWVLRSLPTDQDDTDLVAFIEEQNVHSLLVIYHNWKSRLVPANPRTVHLSTALGRNPLFDQYKAELAEIIRDIEQGCQLTKYLSRGVMIAADRPKRNSGLLGRRDLDLLLNDWSIHHLHLSTKGEKDSFVSRTGPLLFAVFDPSSAYLLDIMKHGSWTSKHLVEVLVREFPESRSFYTIEGVAGLTSEPDENGRRLRRDRGANSALLIDGKVVTSVGGIMSTGTTLSATRESDILLEAVQGFERAWEEKSLQVRRTAANGHAAAPEKISLEFGIHETAGPGFLDEDSMTFYPLFCSESA